MGDKGDKVGPIVDATIKLNAQLHHRMTTTTTIIFYYYYYYK